MTIKNTIIIWDEVEEKIIFFDAPGDYTALNGLYVNSVEILPKQENELINLIYHEDTGSYRLPGLKEFPADKFIPGETAVINCGTF